MRSPRQLLLVLAVLASIPALRAQVTETPFTIAPGHFQLRVDALTVGFDSEDTRPRRYTALGIAHSLFQIGLTSSTDLQIGAQLFARQTYQTGTGRTSDSGFGDTTFRVKYTFWRDAGAGAAAAVIPYVKIPSSSPGVGTDGTEYGFIVPWAMGLPGGFQSGASFQWDVQRNDARNGYDSVWTTGAYVGRDVTSHVNFYAESTFGVSSASKSSFAGTLGAGLTVRASQGISWEYGLSRGLGARATDWVSRVRFRWGF
ncbi:MAG: hypothetical protein RL324_188 [Verrucomicrobiota bacterium]|jgi:hypothetical protein